MWHREEPSKSAFGGEACGEAPKAPVVASTGGDGISRSGGVPFTPRAPRLAATVEKGWASEFPYLLIQQAAAWKLNCLTQEMSDSIVLEIFFEIGDQG